MYNACLPIFDKQSAVALGASANILLLQSLVCAKWEVLTPEPPEECSGEAQHQVASSLPLHLHHHHHQAAAAGLLGRSTPPPLSPQLPESNNQCGNRDDSVHAQLRPASEMRVVPNIAQEFCRSGALDIVLRKSGHNKTDVTPTTANTVLEQYSSVSATGTVNTH